ncbi:uncharacterized protein [Periplaneta americana]|uniref:uncharacterized protein n=1 Tax=Periplaneta americana TaxID=6978 RepID=UPI0037E98F64
MADPAQPPKEKKKRKSEVKKSDLPGGKKATESNSLEAKEKAASRKASATAETAPGPKPVVKAEVESVEEVKPKEKKPKPILKPVATVEVESSPTPPPTLKPVATVEVNEEPTAKPSLKPVATAEVEVEETIALGKPKPNLKPVATVEVTEEEPAKKPVLKPVATVEVEDDEGNTPPAKQPLTPVVSVEVDDDGLPFKSRKASYVPPKAATRRDIDLLYDLENEKIAELREAFHLFDLNNDGYIDKEDLKNTYVTLGKPDIRDDEIQQMLSEAMNPLDFDAFVILLGYKSIELDPEEVLLEALSQWDYDNSGLISEDRIKHDLTMWGDRFTQDEVEVALEDAPVFYRQDTGQTMIDYVQFCKILCGLRKKPKMPQPGDFVPPKC